MINFVFHNKRPNVFSLSSSVVQRSIYLIFHPRIFPTNLPNIIKKTFLGKSSLDQFSHPRMFRGSHSTYSRDGWSNKFSRE